MNPRETNLKIINTAVAKVSDTMTLTFGCRLYQPEHKKTLVYIGKDNGQFAVKFEEDGTLIIADSISDCEILGREAQLADVLLAIGKFSKKTHENCVQAIAIDHTGKIARVTVFNKGGVDSIVLGKWNLAAGGIEHQEDSTIAFIAELLK